MIANAEREVDALRLESRNLATQEIDRRIVARAHCTKELLVAFVAAEDRVGKIEEDHARFGEERIALVFHAALCHRVAGSCSDRYGARLVRTLSVACIGTASAWKCGRANVGAAIPRRALPKLFCARIGIALRCGESRRLRLPCGKACVGLSRYVVIGSDGAAVERFGGRPDCLAAEAERLSLIRRQRVERAGAGIHREDDHVLAELAEVGDEAAATERRVIGMRRDEDVAHAQPLRRRCGRCARIWRCAWCWRCVECLGHTLDEAVVAGKESVGDDANHRKGDERHEEAWSTVAALRPSGTRGGGEVVFNRHGEILAGLSGVRRNP